MDDWSGLAASLGGGPALADALRDTYAAGAARWSTLPSVPVADWVAQLAAHLPADGDRAAHVRGLVATDLYLACACALGIGAAIAAFDAEYLGRIGAYVAHLDGSRELADEVHQILSERMLVGRADARPRIADYAGRGALASWVKVAAVRAALDLRASPAHARRDDDAELIDGLGGDGSPELEVLRQRHAAVFADAVRRAIRALPSNERVLLRMYFASGHNTSHIAAAFRIDRSTAARRLVAARRAVFEATKQLVQDQLPIASSEFASLARALHDHVQLSLASLLADPAADPHRG